MKVALWYPVRPWTANSDRATTHWGEKATKTKEWRTAFCLMARGQRIPDLGIITVTAIPHQKTYAHMPDVGACYPAAKAAIDGLVDAGVVEDDNPKFVKRLVFEAPVVGHEERPEGLLLVVERWAPDEELRELGAQME